MSLKDGEMQAVSVLGTALLSSALFVGILWFTKAAPEQRVKLGEMDAIEASVAYKTAPMKQPQKHFKAPDPVHKAPGVSHDEKKHVEKKKPDDKQDKPPKKDDTDPFSKFKHPNDDSDDPTGKPTTQPGDFNGNEFGWAPTNTGDPFWQGLTLILHQNFQVPKIVSANGQPVVCVHITPDGKVVDTQLRTTSGSSDEDLAAKQAVDALAKLRNQNPIEVPVQLLGAIHRWVCFRLDPNQD